MNKLAILVIVLLGLAYFIEAREERLFFGKRPVCKFIYTCIHIYIIALLLFWVYTLLIAVNDEITIIS